MEETITQCIPFENKLIVRYSDGHTSVFQKEENTKAQLREIAAKAGIEIDPTWNCRYLPVAIINKLSTK